MSVTACIVRLDYWSSIEYLTDNPAVVHLHHSPFKQDKRNFLRNPPAGVDFYFDFDASHPIAMVMLQDDPVLEKMRFELVPKK